MGFGLEQAFVRKVIEREPGPQYIGLFEPTPRNGPAAALFENSGFAPDEAARWILQDPSSAAPVPPWFKEER
jgi:hypothetical protein